MKSTLLGLLIFSLLSSCGPKQEELLEAQYDNAKKAFSDSVTSFNVEVYYEPSTAPYVGNLGNTANKAWDITHQSFTELFDNHPGRTISVPTALSAMTVLPAQQRQVWNRSDLTSLGDQLAKQMAQDDRVTLTVFFLKGTFEGNANILGTQITGYPYAFIFKDVVTAVGGDSTTQKYVEQAIVIHELGHAVGLVNHGIPMVNKHEDTTHRQHHDGSNCVMAYNVENKGTVLNAISGMISGNQMGLFGTSSLSDARSFHP